MLADSDSSYKLACFANITSRSRVERCVGASVTKRNLNMHWKISQFKVI